jgi:hypothetical protein
VVITVPVPWLNPVGPISIFVEFTLLPLSK